MPKQKHSAEGTANELVTDGGTDQHDDGDGRTSETESGESTGPTFPWGEPPAKTFGDIGGYEEVKRRLTERVVKPIVTHRESFQRLNIQPPRGLLFYSPPGTGKTMFARGLANSLNKPFVELTQASLTHEYINKPPQLIQTLFDEAEEREGV